MPAKHLLYWIIVLKIYHSPPETHLRGGDFLVTSEPVFGLPGSNLQTRGRFLQLKKYYAEPR
jgi:hypothetical protein